MLNQIPLYPSKMVLVSLVASLLISCNPANGINPAQLSPPFKVLAADKVTICHLPPGNPENAQTLSIATSALATHLEHGDHTGECAAVPIASPTAVATSTPTATNTPVATPLPEPTALPTPIATATPLPEPTATSTPAAPATPPPPPQPMPARPKYTPTKPFMPPGRPMFMPRIVMPMMTARTMKTVTVRVNVMVKGHFAGFGGFADDHCSPEEEHLNPGPRRMPPPAHPIHHPHDDHDHAIK